MDLQIDPAREGEHIETGIYVRAQAPSGRWVSADISQLTALSLVAWLRSRGGENPYAENVVGILLGHGHIVDAETQAPHAGEPIHAIGCDMDEDCAGDCQEDS